jgi:hypothetical protein
MKDVNAAFEIAIAENPANDPANQGHARTEAISLFKKKWNPQRRIINVSFVEEPSYLDKIISHARNWEPFIGVKFRFGESNPDVLVSFDPGGSWSYIGTDSLNFATRERSSMNFGWFDATTDDKEFNRTVVHEFGHALSLVHEHSHPDANISWNKPVVYAYYQKQGWSKDDVDQQIFAKYDLSQVNGSQYDPHSIMHYPIDASMVTNPADVVGWNTDLSELDKEVIASLYPKLSMQIPT